LKDCPNIKTLAELIDRSAKLYGPRKLFGQKEQGVWHWITYSEFTQKVDRLRAAFAEMGMQAGDAAAVIASNSIAFALTAYAAYGLGATIVPMYEVQKSDDWKYIIQDCSAKFVFTGNDKIKEIIQSMNLENVKRVISFRPVKAENNFDSIERMIESHPQGMKRMDVDENSIADILYTSGTTGMPKGVELTHHNIIQNAIHTFDGFDASCEDRSLSFLPWAHAFGKTVELHIFPYFGASIAIAESAKTIQTDLLEVSPTILNGVPKIFNKFYDKMIVKASTHMLSNEAFRLIDKLSIKERNGKLSFVESLQLKAASKVIRPFILKGLGGKLRFCISGGAPLAIEVISFFNHFGITIYEGYGMTETAPIIAVNKHNNVKFGSVGKVLNCNKVTIQPVDDQDSKKLGEIVVSGECVMNQYHNLPEVTQEVLIDGAFHTGDLGYIDDDGYLFITGRVKEQYKLENGKYVVPGALEEKLNTSHAIEHAVIFGSGHPFNIALIRPTNDFIEKFVNENKLEGASQSQLETNPVLRKTLLDEVQRVSADFRGYEKPQKIEVILDEFTIQNGILTPALKLKRREIEKRYHDKIEALYKKA